MLQSRRGAAERGSQKWLQRAVNDQSTLLDQAIIASSHGKIPGPITWRSPLRAEEYAEYHDRRFLDCLGIRLTKRPLETFWPDGGPHWDALGVGADGAAILVEAKSHAAEMDSSCGASAPGSLKRIRESLTDVQRHLGVDPSNDWTSCYYQYANRLAHLHLLRELNGIPTWLVFLYFVGDTEMKGPSRPEDWMPIRQAIHDALGLHADVLPFVVDAYLDVRALAEPVIHAPAAER